MVLYYIQVDNFGYDSLEIYFFRKWLWFSFFGEQSAGNKFDTWGAGDKTFFSFPFNKQFYVEVAVLYQ